MNGVNAGFRRLPGAYTVFVHTDGKRKYIDQLEPCDGPEYRFEATRREFGAFGAGLLCSLVRPATAADPQQRTVVRVHIPEAGPITVFTGKIEMGQGSRTVLTQVAADALGVPLSRIRLLMGDTALVPDDGGTWGSLTASQTVPAIRNAANQARRMLDVIDGARPVPPPVTGTPVQPVHGRAIVTGDHKYASDVTRPGMKHGRVIRAPGYAATLLSHDSGPGIVRDRNFLGFVSPAPRSSSEPKAEWRVESLPAREAMLSAFRSGGIAPQPGEGGRYPSLVSVGDVESGLKRAARTAAAEYRVANIAHVPLEPRAAIAEWVDGHLTVWSGTQAPFLVRKDLAAALRVAEDRIRVIAVDCGGAFGGKQRGEVEIEAARLARDAGAPVRLAWSRHEEFTAAYCRPAGVLTVEAGLDANNRISAWRHRNYNSGAASLHPPYSIPDFRCEYYRAESPLRQGSYRSLAGVANTFAREAHVDHLAELARMDPLDFRLHNTADERLRHVLTIAAEQFGWSRRDRSRTGVSCNIEKDARLALFVEMTVATGSARVSRMVAAVDPGAVLNPDGLRNQTEGALIQGIGGALFEELTFDRRHITNASLRTYRVPRFSNVPKIDVLIVDRPEIPSAGFGEAPITLVAPALAAALGGGPERRSLPLLKRQAS